MAELQRAACVGDKGAENVVVAKDGECLCYDPPWEGGVRPPNERERDARTDFDGTFLCRVSGHPEIDRAYCPISQPAVGDACSPRDQMLRNADCLYVGPDMKTLIHARCDEGRWREVPQAEIDGQRVMRQ